jgi:peptide/nickel transport system ATP-binding protein/oligopeptide transport system ATP-binding protein
MIFQEPMTSLNPVFTVGRQITESLVHHRDCSRTEARKKAVDMLKQVGIPAPEKTADDYPHQLSGGMRQRVMIAMALVCNPTILIADEPTTALDVTIQAQILRLLSDLQQKTGASIALITHDLGIVAQIAKNVMVMYAGEVVEHSDVASIFKEPLHPYTLGLLSSMPKLGADVARLYSIKGAVPSPLNYPKGCRFAPRCVQAQPECFERKPGLCRRGNRTVRCLRFEANPKT